MSNPRVNLSVPPKAKYPSLTLGEKILATAIIFIVVAGAWAFAVWWILELRKWL